jgi:hypothetical protein
MSHVNDRDESRAFHRNDNPVVMWLQELQKHADTSDDLAVSRSLRFAGEIMGTVYLAFQREQERGADLVDASSVLPVALAHSLVAIASTVDAQMPLLDIVRVLASETFSAAEQLAAAVEEHVALPSSE